MIMKSRCKTSYDTSNILFTANFTRKQINYSCRITIKGMIDMKSAYFQYIYIYIYIYIYSIYIDIYIYIFNIYIYIYIYMYK